MSAGSLETQGKCNYWASSRGLLRLAKAVSALAPAISLSCVCLQMQRKQMGLAGGSRNRLGSHNCAHTHCAPDPSLSEPWLQPHFLTVSQTMSALL